MFSCQIFNLVGEVWTKKAWVTVEDFESLRIIQEPEFPNYFPHCIGSTILLECSAIGSGRIEYQVSNQFKL